VQFVPAEIPGPLWVHSDSRADDRGTVRFLWNAGEASAVGLPTAFAYENHLTSKRWALRGIHCQMTRPQGKLVHCLHGRVFEVAVDLRAGSPTHGRWMGGELDAAQGTGFWLPPGFAHGVLALTDDAIVSIRGSTPLVGADELTLRWDDPAVAVPWPLPLGTHPILSARDAAGLSLSEIGRAEI
jgi:dTDP-4-dehydrorhamnose 3,5-epimerase